MRPAPSSDDYYPTVSIVALMRILSDNKLSSHHSAVTQALMLIFKSLGMQCVPYLDQIVPHIIKTLRGSGPGLRDSLLLQLSQLASIIQYHIAPFLPILFDVVTDFWGAHSDSLLVLVEAIALASPDSFEPFMNQVIPLLLGSLTVPKATFGDAESITFNSSSDVQKQKVKWQLEGKVDSPMGFIAAMGQALKGLFMKESPKKQVTSNVVRSSAADTNRVEW